MLFKSTPVPGLYIELHEIPLILEFTEPNRCGFGTVNVRNRDQGFCRCILLNAFDFCREWMRSVFCVALKMEDVFKEKAKANQILAGGDKKSEVVRSLPQKSAEAIVTLKATSTPFVEFQQAYQKKKAVAPIETRVELAKIAGVSHDTIAKVKKIVADATPEVKAKVERGEMSINEAHKQIKSAEKCELIEQKQLLSQNIFIIFDFYLDKNQKRIILDTDDEDRDNKNQ